VLFSSVLVAQVDIEATVKGNTASNRMQNKLIVEIQDILDAQNSKIDTVMDITDVNTANIEMISDTLHLKVLDAHARAHDAHNRIENIDATVATNKTYWMIGSAVFVLLIGLLFFMLKKQIEMVLATAESKLAKTEKTFKEDILNLKEKLSSANKAQEAMGLKLVSTISELESTDEILANTRKSLERSDQKLEDITKVQKSTNEVLGNTNKALDEANKKMEELARTKE
jgi:hypothetical protein